MEAAERSILTAKFDYLEAANEDMAKLAQAYGFKVCGAPSV